MSKILPYPEYFKSLPKKPTGSGALIFNKSGELLILNTTYNNSWIIPGGIVDADESPLQACRREIKEELGLTIKVGRLLCVDYKVTKDPALQDDSLQFIFDGGIIGAAQIKKIKLNPEEHSEYKFATIKEAQKLLFPKLAQRLPHCMNALKAGEFVYLEDARPISL